MSTWAARLSSEGRSPASQTTSQQSTPFLTSAAAPSSLPPIMGALSPSGSPTSAGAISSTTASAPYAAGGVWQTGRPSADDAEMRARREEFRQIAEAHNRDPREVPVMQLPVDVWELITGFMGYADLVQLAHTTRSLWSFLMRSDSIWEQQLRFFHEDMLDLRGGSLLMTCFAVPPESTAVGATRAAPDRFWREKRLYVLDAHREWHFRELASLEDTDTGVFTVPLHLGHETRASPAAAPLSRPSPPPTHPTGARRRRAAQRLGGSASDTDGDEDVAGGAPAPRVPAVGAAFVGPHGGRLRLSVYRPVRVGECMPPGCTTTVTHSDGEGASAASWTGLDPASSGESGGPWLAQGEEAAAGEFDFPSDRPATLEEEAAALSYVLALSEAEARGLSPPTAPPMYQRAPISGAGRSGGRPQPHQPTPAHGSLATPTRPRWVGRGGQQAAEPAALKPSELLTILELLNAGMESRSRIPIVDVTAAQSPQFLSALEETLKGAKRRRLRLGNHHRAVQNNGYTRRNRSGRLATQQRQESHAQASSLPQAGAPGSFTAYNDPSNLSASPGSAPDVPSTLPPPPINRMLRHFTGRLVEINKREAHDVCVQLLGKPELIHDFVIFPRANPAQTPRDVYPPTRYFLAPELAPHGYIGLIIVDVVRVLVAVEKDCASRTEEADWELDEAPMQAGRLLRPGQGLNAQYYTRDELRPL